MKRILKIICLIVVSIICVGCFFSCDKTGPIPNGYYCSSREGENIYVRTGDDIRETFGWEIKGDTAQRWTSGSVDYKAKIVERDGKIYFEGYKWKDLFFDKCKLKGTEFVKSKLKDLDLSTCNISDMALDINYIKGLIVSYDQAATISTILGIKIKN